MRLTNQAIRRGSVHAAERTLLGWVPTADDPTDHRGFEWFHLWDACHDNAIEQSITYYLKVFQADFVDDSRIAVGWQSSNVEVWELSRASDAKHTMTMGIDSIEVKALKRSHRENWIVTVDSGGTASLFNLEDATKIESFSVNDNRPLRVSPVVDVSHDDRFIAVTGWIKAGQLFVVWDRATGEYAAPTFVESAGRRTVAKFSAEGYLFAGGDELPRLLVYRDFVPQQSNDGFSAAPLELELNADGITALACSENGRLLAVGSLSKSGPRRNVSLQIWDVAELKRLTEITLGEHEIKSLEFNADASLLAVGSSRGKLSLIDTKGLGILGFPRLAQRRRERHRVLGRWVTNGDGWE